MSDAAPSGPPDPLATPEEYPVPPPREVEANQRVYELHGKVAKLEQQVQHLEHDRAALKAALDSVQKSVGTQQKVIWTAAGVLLLLGFLTAGFGGRIWDAWMQVHDLLQRRPVVTPPVQR